MSDALGLNFDRLQVPSAGTTTSAGAVVMAKLALGRGIAAIDPGPLDSGLVVLNHDFTIRQALNLPNDELRHRLKQATPRFVDSHALVIEDAESYGAAVGSELFEAIRWSGRFQEVWPGVATFIRRTQIKLHLTGKRNTRDAELRDVLVHRYGGDKATAVGTKKAPGPCFGFNSHLWAALALAVTALEQAQRPVDERTGTV